MHNLAGPGQQPQEDPTFDSVYAETNFQETSAALEAQRVQIMQVSRIVKGVWVLVQHARYSRQQYIPMPALCS